MNPLFDFTRLELAVIGMALQAISDTTNVAIEQGINPPEGFAETISSTLDKFQQVIEERIKHDEAFDSITGSLQDVLLMSKVIESNPEIPTTEYNQ